MMGVLGWMIVDCLPQEWEQERSRAFQRLEASSPCHLHYNI